MESEVKQMAYFLSSDQGMEQSSSNAPINLLNDGVIRKDFVETKIGHLIAIEFFQDLHADFSQKWEKMRRFQPYQHPSAPFLSATLLWERFHPKINENLKALKGKEKFGEEEFSILADLYLQQYQFPASALKRWVVFQQRQQPEIPFDERLYHDDLALFGFHSSSDWFSQEYLELISQFILNSSLLAEKEGYVVTFEEARKNLWTNFHSYMQSAFSNEKFTEENLGTIFDRQLALLGMDEKKTVSLWRKILLFRKWIDGKAAGAQLDPLPTDEFSSFANQKYTVESYNLPKTIQLKNLNDLFLFHTYLKAVFPARENLLDIPNSPLPVEQIKKEHPSLIKKKSVLDIAQVTKEEVALRVKVKELWAWQMEDSNWDLLKNEFQVLRDGKDRFKKLSSLDPNVRAKIDAFSLEKILQAHPEWITEELNKKKLSTKEITKNSLLKQPLQGIEDVDAFLLHLDKSDLGSEQLYTQDQKVYSKFVLKERGEEEILSYSEARSSGLLDGILDNLLEKEYPKVRSKAPKLLKTKDGEWKPWESVKDEIATLVFSDLMKAIEKDAAQKVGNLETEKYPFYFFCSYLSKAQKDPSLIGEQVLNSFEGQFKLIKRERTLSKLELGSFALTSAKEGDFLLSRDFTDTPYMIQLLSKEKEAGSFLSEDSLFNETKMASMENLVSEWKDKKVLSLRQ